MKAEHLKRLPTLIFSVMLLLSGLGSVYADTTSQPYMKTFGSDIMSGGWFESGSSCDTSATSDFQDGATLAPENRAGGILTYAKQGAAATNSGVGSSSQYAAYSLGSIDGDNSNNGNGFYSAGALAATTETAKNLLSFANTSASNPWGGLFQGSSRQQDDCVPDYYSKKPDTASVVNTPLNAYADSSDSYSVTVPAGSIYSLTSSDVTIAAGKHVTVFVSGNVYIGNNIFTSSNAATDVPKFALVAKGSIYIDPSVTNLDGFYVAQPSANDAAALTADTGVIWTCHPNNTAQLDYTYPATNCGQPLTVNGGLVAKQVNFLRVKGNLAGAVAKTEDTLSGAQASGNIAEIINYTPLMVIGGGFFATSPSSSHAPPLDSVISLPPVF